MGKGEQSHLIHISIIIFQPSFFIKPKQLIIKILNQMMTFLIDYIFYNITFIQS